MASANKSDPRKSKLEAKFNEVQGAWKDIVKETKMTGTDSAIEDLGLPWVATGARAYITVAGMPYAVAQSVNYRITSTVEELRTVDTNFAWDIVPGQVRIQAQLQGLVDPEQPAEVDALWCNMASIIHQPFVDLEIFDMSGERMFAAKGMFTSMSVGLAMGAPSMRTVEFIGTTYVHNVSQRFVPYGPLAKYKSIGSKISKATGGIL